MRSIRPLPARLAAGLAAVALLASAAPSSALADTGWPARPVTLVVPVAPGGATDRVARLMAQSLQKRLGQPVVIDNKPGASSNIGAALVARAAPDGYTVLVSGGPFSINPGLFSSLPFDSVRDFTPVAHVAAFYSVLIVNPAFPAKTIDEFVALARQPGQGVTYASAGNGTSQHLTMELLRSGARLNLSHVPYKGGAPALADLLGNHVGAMLSGMGEAAPVLREGRVRPLATTGPKRSAMLPDLPTLRELGLLDVDTAGWIGLHAPAGTPAPVIGRLNAAINATLAEPEVVTVLQSLDIEARPGSPEDFGRFVASQMAGWREAVRVSGAKAD